MPVLLKTSDLSIAVSSGVILNRVKQHHLFFLKLRCHVENLRSLYLTSVIAISLRESQL